MMDDIEIKSQGYEIELTHVPSGKKAKVTLHETNSTWVVKAEGYQGYFKHLDVAYKEALRHLQFKTKQQRKCDG